jgi:MerR family transcriptional regulator, thiopeptide resistance regulator
MKEHEHRDGYTVGEVARLSGVSVRTLHHYDEVALLTPAGRSAAGYRIYSADDLRRLQQILFYRELEFSLDEIAAMLADPTVDTDDHLRRQHRLVRERQARNAGLLAAIEKEMEARSMGISLTPEEQFELFGTHDIEEHLQEAEAKWGETDTWKESKRRSAKYTKADWVEIKTEADANIVGFVEAQWAGDPPTGPVAMDLAEEHRQHLCRWFFACGATMHRGLGDLYISDERYYTEYEKLHPGFSQYLRDAFHANADRL